MQESIAFALALTAISATPARAEQEEEAGLFQDAFQAWCNHNIEKVRSFCEKQPDGKFTYVPAEANRGVAIACCTYGF